jgi:hypothetical protein
MPKPINRVFEHPKICRRSESLEAKTIRSPATQSTMSHDGTSEPKILNDTHRIIVEITRHSIRIAERIGDATRLFLDYSFAFTNLLTL